MLGSCDIRPGMCRRELPVGRKGTWAGVTWVTSAGQGGEDTLARELSTLLAFKLLVLSEIGAARGRRRVMKKLSS